MIRGRGDHAIHNHLEKGNSSWLVGPTAPFEDVFCIGSLCNGTVKIGLASTVEASKSDASVLPSTSTSINLKRDGSDEDGFCILVGK